MVDSEDRYSTEKASSVQSMILYDCEAEALSNSIRPGQSYFVMVKWRCCLELVQIHGFRSVEVLLDIPPGRPKNCPEARGGSVRVQISPSRPVSVFMIKPRVCPSRGQFSPVQSRRPLGFGQVLSDQPAASRLEHCELADLLVVMLVLRVLCHIGRTTSTSGVLSLRFFPRDCVSSVVPTAGAKPAHARHVWGGLVFPRPRIQQSQGNPLIRWIGKTQIEWVMAYG
ncbi:hypothetical protein YC2023_089302 [Brassica napus]